MGQTCAFSNFLVPDWALGPVQMCRDRQDIVGRALKARFCRVFVEKVDFSFKFGSPSVTYPFWGPLTLEDCSRNASTRFGACFSFRTRSSNLLSHSQSLPNHEFSEKGQIKIESAQLCDPPPHEFSLALSSSSVLNILRSP